MASSIKINSFGYSTAINDLFIGKLNGVVSDGSHTSDLSGQWVLNIAKFDKDHYYVQVGMITGYSNQSASTIWADWGKDTVVYNVHWVSDIITCPILNDYMCHMGNIDNQYRADVLDYVLGKS